MRGMRKALVVLCLFFSACGPSAGAGDDDDALVDGGGTDGGAGADGATCGTDEDQQGCGCDSVGAMRACYGGPAGTRAVGLCADGMQTCVAREMTSEGFLSPGVWGACGGDVRPAAAEQCGDGMDHDCNGASGCSDLACATETACQKECQPGETRPCYTGPASTAGVGACHPGRESCSAAGKWDGTCSGQVTPGSQESFTTCNDNIDNDCNGRKDCQDFFCLVVSSSCAPTICTAGAMQACYDGPAGTDGVAACHGGMQTCASDGKSWGACMNQALPVAEGGRCGDGVDNDCNGQIDCADPACGSAANCCVPSAGGVDGTIYAHSSTDLYTVNPSGWVVTRVGAFANGDQMTDIAVTPDGRLYGISFTSLYSISKTTAKATFIADVPGSSNNGLTFLPGGDLLAADSAGDLKRINPATGAVTQIGNFNQSLSSSGDLAAIANGTMFGVSTTNAGGGDASGNNVLLRINTGTGAATPVGPIGFGWVWGLAYVNAKVIGFTTAGQIIEIDPQTGAGTLLANRSIVWWGAGMSPLTQASVCP